MVVLCFSFAYFLYKIGGWAGGDVKLFTGFGAMLPVYGKLGFFPFFTLGASVLAVFPFLAAYLLYFFITTKKLRGIIAEKMSSGLRKSLVAALVVPLLFFQTPAEFLINFFYVFAVSFIFLCGIAGFGIARKHILRETVKINDAKEGMMLADDIFYKGRKIASRLARGLTKEELQTLKRIRIKKIEVRKSLPFVPVMLVGIFLLVLLG
jgi:hypothetical protein